jgi:hypothetical protein
VSLARLAALARRGAAPVGVMAEATRPAFDPLVMLDAAAAEAAARTLPGRGDVRAGTLAVRPLPVPPHGAVPQPPLAAPFAGRATAPPPPDRSEPATPPMPSATEQPIAAEASRIPEARTDDVVSQALPMAGPIDPAVHAAPPRATPPPPMRVETLHVPVHTAPVIATSSAPPPLPTAEPAQPMLRPAPDAAPPALAPVTFPAKPHEPTITIGRIDVVMAPPPTPPPAPTAPRASDRSFARYAAMRSARDRARW